MTRKKATRTLARRSAGAPDAPWFVYLLRCGDGSLYAGITNDVARRFGQHAAGTASRYTRSRLPVKLVYLEPQRDRSAASKREAAIKALTRREKQAMVLTQVRTHRRLSPSAQISMRRPSAAR